jgi:hypothetical protein
MEKSILPCALLAHLSKDFLEVIIFPISAALPKQPSISLCTMSYNFKISPRMRLHSALMQLNWKQLLLINLPFRGSIILSRLLKRI